MKMKSLQLCVIGLGLDPSEAWQFNTDWSELRDKFTKVFASKTQAEWCQIFDDKDACVTPVLTMDEAVAYPHNQQQGTFRKTEAGLDVPRPAPTLSRTPGEQEELPGPSSGQHTSLILAELGYSQDDIASLMKEGAVDQADPASKL